MEVSVLLTTYNHERHIAQALDGVLMQETKFAFEIVILEDCSTDATREIVIAYQKRHSDKIRLRLADQNENNNDAFAEEFLASPSPYIAMLDGDDYWTSPKKLQTQVEFLRAYPECALCFHNALRIYEDGSRVPFRHNPMGQKRISVLEDLWERNFIAGCTAMLRKDVLGQFPDWFYDLPYGDWPLYILCAQHGEIGYIDEIFGVYRVHSGGVWSGVDPIRKLESLIAFYQIMNANLDFRFNPIVEPLISARQKQLADARALVETAQTLLPTGVVVIGMCCPHEEPPRLEGHQVWVFPDQRGTPIQRHFASGPTGSAEAHWIRAGTAYEFRLCKEDAGQSKVLASVVVTQNNTALYTPTSGQPHNKNGAFIDASPNPVPAGPNRGKTIIKWSTGDGSNGVIHVTEKSLQAHYPPDGCEAIAHLERLRAEGGEFLLAPRSAFAFFEQYPDLKEYLDRHYRVVEDDQLCRIYDVRKTLENAGGHSRETENQS
jgi:hypothetical protein